jgi:hypothetical protein
LVNFKHKEHNGYIKNTKNKSYKKYNNEILKYNEYYILLTLEISVFVFSSATAAGTMADERSSNETSFTYKAELVKFIKYVRIV